MLIVMSRGEMHIWTLGARALYMADLSGACLPTFVVLFLQLSSQEDHTAIELRVQLQSRLLQYSCLPREFSRHLDPDI